MKLFFYFRISKLNELMIICVLGITTFSMPAMANPIRDLQDEVTKRGISPEDVNTAMRKRFPNSDFTYYEPPNGCSNPLPGFDRENIVFKGACNNHDRCYATPGKRRNICDVEMLREMLRICSKIPISKCSYWAERYYDGVDEFGQNAYEAAQRQQTEYIKSVNEWLNTPNATVFQTNSYINTGIAVRPGDRIRIKASGTVQFGLFAGSGGPNGIIFNPVYNYFANVPHGRLMARFRQPGMQDLDGWFPIGEGWDKVREVKLPSPGILEFLVNDNQPGDNRGKFRIEVTIHSGKQ